MRFPFLLILVFNFAACTKSVSAIAHIKGVGSSQINGVATFVEVNGFVNLVVEIRQADADTVAIHIHEIGDCESSDGSSAGGHWNPTNEKHGKWGVPPFHSGDIGNMEISNNGKGSMVMKDHFKRWSITNPGNTNIIGRAIIIHSGVDDYSSQPSGAAGPRIGCGVIG